MGDSFWAGFLLLVATGSPAADHTRTASTGETGGLAQAELPRGHVWQGDSCFCKDLCAGAGLCGLVVGS